MIIVEILFWMSLLFLLYVYGGYVVLTLPFKRQPQVTDESLRPTCTLVIAAYNEEKIIGQKIENSLALDYPKELLEIIIVADGSTDRTQDVIGHYPSVKFFYQPERQGKLAAIQRIWPAIQSEIVVFTDANSFLNSTAIKSLVQHFADPKVGGVSGEKKVSRLPTTTGTEGLYWKYESWLKKKDAEFYSIAGAAGELFAIRSTLYTPLDENLVLDDFIQSMLVCNQGYRVVYEQSAVAAELPSPTLKDEFARKVRIAAGGFQATSYLNNKMDFRKFPKLGFVYFSHRVFRWQLAPFAFFALLPLNIFIGMFHQSPFYLTVLVFQVFFYILAIVRNYFSIYGKSTTFISLVHYFFFMQLAVIAGWIKFKGKRQTAIWEKIPRM